MAELHFQDTPEYWANVGGDFAEEIAAGAAGVGAKLAHFVMSYDKNDMDAPLATMFYMPPNFTLLRHDHDCFRVEVVVQGSVTVGDKVLRPGDLSISRPGEPYGPHIAGPTGVLTVEIFSKQGALTPNLHVDTWSAEDLELGAKHDKAIEAWRKAKAELAEKS